MSWVVVLFLAENTVEAIPKSWLISSSECLWPPYDGMKLRASISKSEEPSDVWKTHTIRILGNGKIFENLEKARLNAHRAEYCSDLNSEVEEKSPRKKKRFIYETDKDDDSPLSSTEDCGEAKKLPTPPSKCNIVTDSVSKASTFKRHTMTNSTSPSNSSAKVDNKIGSNSSTNEPIPLDMMQSFCIPKSDTVKAVSDSIFQKQVLRFSSNINIKLDQISEDINAEKFT